MFNLFDAVEKKSASRSRAEMFGAACAEAERQSKSRQEFLNRLLLLQGEFGEFRGNSWIKTYMMPRAQSKPTYPPRCSRLDSVAKHKRGR